MMAAVASFRTISTPVRPRYGRIQALFMIVDSTLLSTPMTTSMVVSCGCHGAGHSFHEHHHAHMHTGMQQQHIDLDVLPHTCAHCLAATKTGYVGGEMCVCVVHARARVQPQYPPTQGGGGNPFANMGNLMENVKKAQMMVQQETARVQQELQEYVGEECVSGEECILFVEYVHVYFYCTTCAHTHTHIHTGWSLRATLRMSLCGCVDGVDGDTASCMEVPYA